MRTPEEVAYSLSNDVIRLRANSNPAISPSQKFLYGSKPFGSHRFMRSSTNAR